MLKILFAHIILVLSMIELCSWLEIEPKKEEIKERQKGTIVINTWAGKINVEGVDEVIQPAIREIRRSNKIEAVENNKQWPELSDDPDDYEE